MVELYPLRFAPLYRRYIWGGRRLATVLGKRLGDGDDFAESWEIVDHGKDQSIVQGGPLAGYTLGQLVKEHGPELLGRHDPQPRFPLLFKFLDAHQNLSVQVHPNDQQAAMQDPPDLGKTEAWVILAADPGSVVYAGLKRGFDRPALEREVARGTVELCLHRIEPRVGDCIYVPAGTVHALGKSLLVAEIQQASDTTFRLFDWNRVGTGGRPRELHVEQALDVIDYGRGPVQPQQPRPTERRQVEQLVDGDKFVLDRWTFDSPLATPDDQRCHIVAVLAGRIAVEHDEPDRTVDRGEVVIIPASLGGVLLTPAEPSVLLDMYLP